MITEKAEIVYLDASYARVRVQECKQVCQNCQCGAKFSLIAPFRQLSSPKFRVLSIAIPSHSSQMIQSTDAFYQVGDQVLIGVSEKQLLAAALIFYLTPLLFLLLFSIFGDFLYFEEHSIIVLGLLGFVCGLKCGSFLSQNLLIEQYLKPVLLSKI